MHAFGIWEFNCTQTSYYETVTRKHSMISSIVGEQEQKQEEDKTLLLEQVGSAFRFTTLH